MNSFRFVPKDSYSYEELVMCGKGELFGPGNAKLPLPPMLMFDAIDKIEKASSAADYQGEVRAHMLVEPGKWFFGCHFFDDPVMPGCLGLDAMWQMLGFFLAWSGGKGYGRALGVKEVKFSGTVVPSTRRIEYLIFVKRILKRRAMAVGVADGTVRADGANIYGAVDLKVGLFASSGERESSG